MENKNYRRRNTPGARARRRKAVLHRRILLCLLAGLLISVSTAAFASSIPATDMPVVGECAELTKTETAILNAAMDHFKTVWLDDMTPASPEVAETKEPEPEWFTVEATAYCSCVKCCGEWALKRPGGVVYTADGSVAKQGVTIAADWSVFPAGTVLYIEGLGERVVQDKGGAINNMDVDVYFDNHGEALQFGRQYLNAYVVSYGE